MKLFSRISKIWRDICVALLLTCPAVYAAQIDGVDYYIAPSGHTVTVTGSGFVGTTGVSLYWIGSGWSPPVSFTVINDTTLEFTMPDFHQGYRDHILIVQHPDGSALTCPDDFTDIYPDDEMPSSFTNVRVKPGATATGNFLGQIIYVETGGILEVGSSFYLGTIIAEEGAVIEYGEGNHLNIIHSDGTLFFGPDEPREAFEVPGDINPSFGHPYFHEGFPLNIEIVGNGSVSKSPDQEFYTRSHDHDIVVTATPDAGFLFNGWSGDVTSDDASLTIDGSSFGTSVNLTATFGAGYVLDVLPIPYANILVSPELDLYPVGEEVTLSATAEPGYEVVGWAGSAQSDTSELTLTISGNSEVWPIVRPINFDELPQITSISDYIAPADHEITLTGQNLENAIGGSLNWGHGFTTFDVSSSEATQAMFPMPFISRNSSSEHIMMLTTSVGATFAIPTEVVEYDVESPEYSFQKTVVVKSGKTLNEILPSFIYYVEAGARISQDAFNHAHMVVAESGAIIEVNGQYFSGSLFYCPGTLILGELPDGPFMNVQNLGVPVRASYDLDYFYRGYELSVDIVGNGGFSASPVGPFYEYNERVNVTAIADPGANFYGWTGDATSASATTEVRMRNDVSLTATFTEGFRVDVPEVEGVAVALDPLKDFYDSGESVMVTATVDPGMDFLGWVGTHQATSLSTTIAMDQHQLLVPVVRPVGYESLPLISSVSNSSPIEGESLSIMGQGFANAESLQLQWLSTSESAQFTVTDDTELTMTMPDLRRPDRPHRLFLHTASGDTVTTSPGAFTYSADADFNRFAEDVIVPFGEEMTGESQPLRTSLIYVEAGGSLNLDGLLALDAIYVEDGGIIDFRNTDSFHGTLFYSSGAVILGELPREAVALDGALRRSPDIAPFMFSYPLDLIIEGPGSVTLDPDKESYARGETVTMTAIPDEGAHFIRWIGPASGSSSNVATIRIDGPETQLVRFSNNPNYFHDWRTTYFTNEELGMLEISGFDADPDGDLLSNAAEYAFGFDPRSSKHEKNFGIIGNGNGNGRLKFFFIRPTTSSDIDYVIKVSEDLSIWRYNGDGSGEVITEVVSVVSLGQDREKIEVEILYEADGPLFIRLDASIIDDI